MFWRTDGSSFPVSYTVTPLLKDGVLCGMVVVFRDITDRRTNNSLKKIGNLNLSHSCGLTRLIRDASTKVRDPEIPIIAVTPTLSR